MNEGMETLQQIATTTLFLQSEKNNLRIVNQRKNEDQLGIVNTSDEENEEASVELNSYLHQLAPKESAHLSLLDTAIKLLDTSFVLEPVRGEHPRPNKLSRSRAPLNQQKLQNLRDSTHTKMLLPSLDASPLSSFGNEVGEEAYTSKTFSLVASRDETQNECMKPSTTQSAQTSFASYMSSFVPELVLSPAKLDQ